MNKIKYIILGLLVLMLYLGVSNYLADLLIPKIHIVKVVIIVGAGFLSYFLFKDIFSDSEEEFSRKLNIGILKSWKWKLFSLILIISTIYLVVHLKRNVPGLYNKSVVYYKQYEKKTTERAGYYDKLWKTYKQKTDISWLNRELFIEITKIIFEGRRDGPSVSWKFIGENQQIPYGEFTRFYADLSTFIETQREGYFNLEKECQEIAMNHNMLIDTFPNNIYNLVLNRKPIKYSYGFLSDSTVKVFNSGRENIK